jgi:pilus assembly protein Flp/PilA
MSKFVTAVRSFVSDEEGATMVEYGLMLALIAVVCIGVVTTLGTKVSTMFQGIANAL